MLDGSSGPKYSQPSKNEQPVLLVSAPRDGDERDIVPLQFNLKLKEVFP